MIITLFSFFVAFASVMLFRPIAIGVGLVDRPCSRKRHQGEVPLVGGLAIYTSIVLSSFLFVEFDNVYKMYMLSTAFLVLIGALDDYHDIEPNIRLIAQVLIGSLMVFGADVQLTNLGNLIGTGDIQLGVLAPIVTLMAVIGAINAFNMTDGVDGLVGTLGIHTFISIGVLAYLGNIEFSSELPAMFIGALIAFLFFNFGRFKRGRYKVFMGDAGSMLLGLTVIWMLAVCTQGESRFVDPTTALWLIAVPLMDMVSVMIRRIMSGLSPLRASRDHLHHILLFKGLSARWTTIFIGVISVIASLLGIIMQESQVPESTRLISFLSVFIAYNFFMCRQDKQMHNHVQ
ncbi:UDP-N-acetylglucosamine--undecaprenyl-phosphateN-acetylglucosaminephosphotransferase [Saliniradius amylolyticus]|uniref:Undecaprenyl-phosphate alpha-N-acetylglucosaminyl 1-phosphate transferase n=2 Tax=Saliniradius amylolyticus TaxID=2183582 RepID=A0A2S2E0X8_9ALTE|nr:UDP-N-acetylglucosamine--undecaprenyl-phosphateN-acetylglucosaminephosphotransferase [Saliniradius amylolyticus]